MSAAGTERPYPGHFLQKSLNAGTRVTNSLLHSAALRMRCQIATGSIDSRWVNDGIQGVERAEHESAAFPELSLAVMTLFPEFVSADVGCVKIPSTRACASLVIVQSEALEIVENVLEFDDQGGMAGS